MVQDFVRPVLEEFWDTCREIRGDFWEPCELLRELTLALRAGGPETKAFMELACTKQLRASVCEANGVYTIMAEEEAVAQSIICSVEDFARQEPSRQYSEQQLALTVTPEKDGRVPKDLEQPEVVRPTKCTGHANTDGQLMHMSEIGARTKTLSTFIGAPAIHIVRPSRIGIATNTPTELTLRTAAGRCEYRIGSTVQHVHGHHIVAHAYTKAPGSSS
jgi:hypothetical protein